jgi:hypothetical protein
MKEDRKDRHLEKFEKSGEDEHCSGARHAGSLSHLLSRALGACRALPAVPALTLASSLTCVALALVCVVPGPALGFASAEASAVMHDVQDVLANYTSQLDGKLYFTSPSGQTWELITDINDPEIANKGDGSFHPFSRDVAEEALAQVSYPSNEIPFEVFILPYPRRGTTESSASPGAMFLSPGVLECSAELVHFTVTHELGHVVHRRFMPDENGELWQRYRDLRNITNASIYNATAIHRNRPNEIFAEDFRFLFGSALANYSGTIENSSLLLPTQVPGLRDFMLSLADAGQGKSGEVASIALHSFPNPFNPVLNVSFSVGLSSTDVPLNLSELASSSPGAISRAFSEGSGASLHRLVLRVYDVSGRLVRTLIDEELSPGSYSAVWRGTDEQGNMVSSGIYFLRLEAGDQALAKKVILSR